MIHNEIVCPIGIDAHHDARIKSRHATGA